MPLSQQEEAALDELSYWEQQQEERHQAHMRRWYFILGFEVGVIASLVTYYILTR